MNNYRMNIYPAKTQDGIQWNVEYPEVFGVGGAGNTPEEAIKDAEENLKVHLSFLQEEGLPIPETMIEEDLPSYSGKFTIRIGKSLHKKAVEIAEQEGISLNAFISEAIAYCCGDKDNKQRYNLLTYILNENNSRRYYYD